jgi:hypothetical protein
MRRPTLLIVLVLSTICGYGRCAFNASVHLRDTVTAFIPAPDQMLAQIIQVMGLQQNFELRQADVLNIEAAISHRKRLILYNPDYIKWLNSSTGDKWATMTLLAHEVGHHLNGHTIRKGGSRPQLELEADEFAGFVLARLGASLREAQEVMTFVASAAGSRTHPSRLARTRAIRKGWEKSFLTAAQ